MAGKVALVTGAGSGIGRAAAVRFAAEGAAVGVLDLGPTRRRDTADRIAKDGGRAVAVAADVADAAQVGEAVARVVAELGRDQRALQQRGRRRAGSVAVAEEDDWDRACG